MRTRVSQRGRCRVLSRGDEAHSDRRLAIGLGCAVALLALSTRLPQFLGGHMLVDGDEAVLGLMAKHLLEGRIVPVFLYGQDYGLASVEAAMGALAFQFGGVSSESLKAAMLMLWALGVWFMALAAARWAGRAGACATALALVFCPGWAAWSMKARGGYLTAFAAASVALWLLAGMDRATPIRRRSWVALGLATGVTAVAQPIAVLAMAPFLARGLLSRDRRSGILPTVATAAATVGAVVVLSRIAPTRVWAPALFTHPDPLRSLLLLPERLWVSLSGAHFFGRAVSPGPWTLGATVLWTGLLVALPMGAQRRLRLGRGDPVLSCLAGVAAVCGFSVAVAPQHFAHQYLFPVPGLVALGAALAWARLWEAGGVLRRCGVMLLSAVLACGTGSLAEFGRLSFSGLSASGGSTEPQLIQRLLERLEGEGIHHAYVDSPMLQWTVAFVSRERVLARWRRALAERIPAYPRAVDAALRAGLPVAIVYVRGPGDDGPPAGLLRENPAAYDISGRFLVLPHVTVGTVRAAGFRLSPR